jgi:cation diffusion facilitator family transporter
VEKVNTLDQEGLHTKRAARLSLIIAIIIFAIKLTAFRMTGSQAIFSEAMETIVNILAAAVALFVIYYASKPADKGHPYGHGKAEHLSAALEGGLIAFAAFIIIVEALQAFYEKRPLQDLNVGAILLAGTGILNFILGYYLLAVGKRQKSSALQASGKHLFADFWTTVGVLGGLALVMMTEIFWLDGVIALLVGGHLIREAYDLIRNSVGALLDEKEEEVLAQIQGVINQNRQEGIIQVHHLRVMRSGNYHHIDAHVVVPEFWTVEDAHDHTQAYEKLIFKNYEYNGEVHFHIDPCRRLYCQYCDYQNCPVRKEEFKFKRKISLDELTSEEEPEEITEQLKE